MYSREGPQQGDPYNVRTTVILRHHPPAIATLDRRLKLASMDDVTLGGPESQIAHDVEEIRCKGIIWSAAE